MHDKSQELPEWNNFDNSPLPVLLRYDRLRPQDGIALICNIDTERSELFSAWSYFGFTAQQRQQIEGAGGPYRDPVQSWMEKDYPEYWRIRRLSDDPSNCPRCWYESLARIVDECDRWREGLLNILGAPPGFGEYPSIDHQYASFEPKDIELQIAAQRMLKEAWNIYFSSPDHGIAPYSEIIDENEFEQMLSRSPSYFINWAESKGIEISWLDWAKARGYIDGQAQTETSDLAALDKRERDTLDTLIGALLNALEIDPSGYAVVKRIEGLALKYGAPIRKTTLTNILKRIPAATESVQDRKSR